jgi:hypothetical protein
MVLRRSVCTGEVLRCGCSDRLRALAAPYNWTSDATVGPSSLKWSPASSGSCSSRQVASDRVLFQHNPVSRSNQALGRQDASSWAAGNSLDADEFGNRLAFVLRHDPPCFVTDYRTSRDCGIRHLPLFGMLGRSALCDGMYPFVSMGKMVNGGVKWLTRQKSAGFA